MSETLSFGPQGVFRTLLGEGPLAGLPALLVRFAGCSVGCSDAGGAGCDADYSVSKRLNLAQFDEQIGRLLYGSIEWCWLSGGEPTDRDLRGVVEVLRRRKLKVALATAGARPIDRTLFDFVSVSPHSIGEWVLREGDSLNVVPGLNGLRLDDFQGADLSGFPPGRRYVTPLADREGRPVNLQECVDFVMGPRGRGWRLGIQAHLHWRMP